MALGLVVEGGGVRAMYAAGVLDVLHDLALPVKGVIGVSAGAIHGCSFVSGQKGRSLRFYSRFIQDDRFFSFKNWFKTGDIVDNDFCYHEIPDVLDPFDEEAFEQSGMDFFVTVTDLETGKPQYLHLTDMRRDIDGLRASASLPYFSKIVSFRGMQLLDGGCSDRIPLKAFQAKGFDKCIVVMTKTRHEQVKDRDAALAPFIYRRYPRFVETFKNSPQSYETTQCYIDEEVLRGNAFVIRPSVPVGVGRLSRDPKDVQRAYEQGRNDALALEDKLLTWIEGAR